MYKHRHDWVVEEIEGQYDDGDPDAEIEAWPYDTAAGMVHHYRNWDATTNSHLRLVVTRDVVDEEGSVIDRSWAYLDKGSDNRHTLPTNFQDENGADVAPVPQYLHKQLANTQA